ncbi:peptidase M48 [Streptomyces hygroscopicus]|uniref:M56 family metallopeptidase n=1 Tax=Streptomyces hygroscopicus TaxID=1912 RepID=UPI00223F1830|nr:M56 family metallopeptidase [Streptomyces hygroscopicus]MCW7946255.1 peptidase M48 [Streptomyces hygroscopicus]
MRIDVYLPLLLSLLLAALSPVVGRRVAPALAARVLAVSAVFTAAATVWSLFLLAITLVNQAPPVVARAHNDGRRLPEPVPEAIALAAVLALVLVAVRVHRTARAERVTRRTLRTLCAGHPPDTELVVAESPVPQAFTIPAGGGAPGRILVTSAMLRALEPAERRVLLAHERAHLAHRHAFLSAAVALAVAADPLLTPVRTTVTFLVERWADEHAADAVGDRSATARALARAALTTGAPGPSCALNFTDRAVTRRIAALQAGPPPHLWPLAATTLALGALPALGVLDATGDLLSMLEYVPV